MRVVVTGASSFIGRWVIKRLCDQGHNVTGTYRRPNAKTEALRAECSGLRLVELDLARVEDFSALPEEVDAVVHIAGVSAVSGGSMDDLLACNVDGTRNIATYALRSGASRLIAASTMSVYGKISDAIVTEQTPIFEPDPYGASKYLAERLLAAESERLPTVALRLPGVLGRGAHRAWLPELVRRLRGGGDVTVYNPESLFNNAVHVEDLACFVGEMLEVHWRGFHAFPLGADGTMCVRDVVSLVAEHLGGGSVTFDRAPRPSFLISSDYAARFFQYRPSDVRHILLRYLESTDHCDSAVAG